MLPKNNVLILVKWDPQFESGYYYIDYILNLST